MPNASQRLIDKTPNTAPLQGISLRNPTQLDTSPDLDQALAVVLSAIRKSKVAGGMDALGELLAYMEKLEKAQGSGNKGKDWITLQHSSTLTLGD